MCIKENDFLRLVKENPQLNEEDLKILLQKRLDHPSQSFYQSMVVYVTILVAMVSLLNSLFVGIKNTLSFVCFLVTVAVASVFGGSIIIQARSASKIEVEIMEQYAEAKNFLNTERTRKLSQ
jgi:uncharacterized membrane protein